MQQLLDTYLPLAEAAATSCNSDACKKYASGQADAFKENVAQGLPGALELERVRFDTYLSSTLQQILEADTYELALCNGEPSCVANLYIKLNASYADIGYVVEAVRNGMRVFQPAPISRASSENPVVAEFDANFTACALGFCEIPVTNKIFRGKRGVFVYLKFWIERLEELQKACISENCTTEVGVELQRSQGDQYLMSDYVPLQIVLPGLLLYALLFVGCVVIAAFGVMWKTFAGKELFWMVLLGVAITAILRIAVWGVGYAGYGTSSLTFVILDKLSSLFFALTILIFVFMWAKGMAILSDASPIFITVMAIVTAVIAVAITAITIVYAVQISRDFVSAFYGEFVADKAELVLACFSFVLIVLLFVFILVVGCRIGELRQDEQLEEKMRNLKLIAVAVGVMVLFLTMRLILVALRNFYQDVALGYSTLYGVATMLPEIICCVIMLGLVLFTFYQSKHISFNTSYSTGKTSSANSAFQSASSATEMQDIRYDV